MISNTYKSQLKNYAKQLDKLFGDTSEFERLIHEITEEQVDIANLEFIKYLTVITEKNMSSKMEQRRDKFVKTLYKYLGSLQIDIQMQHLKDSANVTLEEQFTKLNELIGLDGVKQQINDLIAYNKIQQLRIKNGLKRTDKTLHMAFLGNPGTAKTTVARIIGKMYKAMGFLSKGHFIEASRTDLIAEYQGQTALKVKRLVHRAKGGVLFIDEAYSITENENSDSYGRECLTELTKALEDYRDDLVVIVAGYPDLMELFFASNPGLKSRFNTFITFYDYSLEELMEIFLFICKQNDYVISDAFLERLLPLIEAELTNENEYFSNGRFIRNLFDDITINQSKRLLKSEAEITPQTLMLLTEEDIHSNELAINSY